VHLCGSRYAERAEAETEIKVYSNQPEVALMVDGQLIGKQTGSLVFTWRIPLTGEHTILATAGSCMDQMKLRRVAEPNKAYMFRKQEVVNWFDKDEIDPACFSIRDTLGALQQHPQAAAILAGMMARMRASRGDVAQSASNNANLQRMMAGMTLESLLKQAGNVPAEAVKSLNAALQKIRKG
jgi:beta-galactosidase